MNLNINDDIINLNVSGNSTKIESSDNNIELNILNNNMNVEGESKKLNLGILPPKVVITDKDHSKLLNRDLPNQHPIKSIEGLIENGDGTKFLSDDGTYKEVKIFDDVVEDILVNGASVVDENNNANIFVPTSTSELLNDSGFITNLAKDLVNYYLKSEVYTKEEINEALKDLPTGETELTGGDNTVIEDNKINVYTNTGYKVIDKDIQLQSITDSGTAGTNKIVYAKDKEIMFIIDGTNKLRKSENGIDFEVIDLPRVCNSLIYKTDNKRLIGLSDEGYLLYSEDLGATWNTQEVAITNGATYLFEYRDTLPFFIVADVQNKKVNILTNIFSISNGFTSLIKPEFMTMLNANDYIFCNKEGIFKYGAGSREVNFISLTNVNINMLKNVNNKVIVGQKNSDKLYILKTTTINGNEWIEYTLNDVCTVNDIIFNPYDETYYIFTDINTYYKTKDFINYDSVEKNSLRGIQGHFTLEGIQMTTTSHNELLLAPTRTKLSNKAQEWDRALNKDRWVGPGLKRVGEEQIGINDSYTIGISSGRVILNNGVLTLGYFTEELEEQLKIALAPTIALSPSELEEWFWENWQGGDYDYYKFVFTEAGTIYDLMTYETEYNVEKAEMGYLYTNQYSENTIYVSTAKFGALFQ